MAEVIKDRYYSPDYKGNRIRNVGPPVSPGDVSSKSYVDGIQTSLSSDIQSIETDLASLIGALGTNPTLGTLALQNSNDVTITGGDIDGVIIGANQPSDVYAGRLSSIYQNPTKLLRTYIENTRSNPNDRAVDLFMKAGDSLCMLGVDEGSFGYLDYHGLSTPMEFRYNGADVLRYNNLGLGIGPTINPVSSLHIDLGNATAALIKFTAGTTTGQTLNDGFDIGIDTSGNALIRQRESASLDFYTNNNLALSIAADNNITVVGNIKGPTITLDRTNAQKHIDWYEAGTIQWRLLSDTPASGNDLKLSRFVAGTYIGDSLSISNASGALTTSANVIGFAASIINLGVSFSRQGLNIRAGSATGNTQYLRFTTGDGSTSCNFSYLTTDGVTLDTNLRVNNLRIGASAPNTDAINIDRGNGVGSLIRFTAGTTTGQTTNDGLEIGIDNSANGIIMLKENQNLSIGVSSNNVVTVTALGVTLNNSGSLSCGGILLNNTSTNTTKSISFRSINNIRWNLYSDSDASGANLVFLRHDDSGASTASLILNRLNGQSTFSSAVAGFGMQINNTGATFTRQGLSIQAGNNNGDTQYLRFITASNSSCDFSYSANLGVSLSTRFRPTGLSVGQAPINGAANIHIDAGDAQASSIKFTAGTLTGQTTTDGIDIGINTTGGLDIRQRESAPIDIYTNNTYRGGWSSVGLLSINNGLAVGTNPTTLNNIRSVLWSQSINITASSTSDHTITFTSASVGNGAIFMANFTDTPIANVSIVSVWASDTNTVTIRLRNHGGTDIISQTVTIRVVQLEF